MAAAWTAVAAQRRAQARLDLEVQPGGECRRAELADEPAGQGGGVAVVPEGEQP